MDALAVAYPDEVEVVATLAKYLPKEKLLSFYFDKDQKELEKWFDDLYGATNYKSFILDGKAITYAPFDNDTLRQKYVGDITDILAKKKNVSTVPTK